MPLTIFDVELECDECGHTSSNRSLVLGKDGPKVHQTGILQWSVEQTMKTTTNQLGTIQEEISQSWSVLCPRCRKKESDV